MPGLHTAEDFHTLETECIHHCNTLVDQVITRDPPSIETLYDLDDLSNTLCRVIDAAEVCRNVHPHALFRTSANQCFHALSEYISTLNTHVELYHQVRTLTDSKMETASEEQQRMAWALRLEFERDGIHLASETVRLDQENTRLDDQQGSVGWR